ncbi:MAG TPA: PfkB family carbohydrate kinase [Gemmatimonadales bacterium]|nr:PfkB family carbohydrate kinase [Gemmatimonadales bacterium]
MTPPPAPPTRDRVLRLLERMRTVRVVVLGDAMLDRYLIGDTDRLSPEAPVPVVTVKDTRAALGGAANVAANVVAVGARCHLVASVGDDPHGRALREELGRAGLDDRTLVTVAGRATTTKTRVIARGQQVVRIDEEVEAPLEPSALERVTDLLHETLADADALLLEDYNKGLLAAPLITAAVAAALRRGVPVVVDPKYRHFFEYAGATVFKPNRRELEAALGAAVDLEHRDALPRALERLKVDNLLLTLGADGMVLVTKAKEIVHLPSIAREVFDVSGAGDTVTAWVGAALAAGATLVEAATLANYAAGIEVGKAGVATVTPEELLAVYEERFDQVGMLQRGGAL